MKWSPEQEQALDAVGRWLRERNQPIFRLFGYAGTGKSTLAMHLAEGAGLVKFACFTGKAAHVMQRKGCDGAQTIHSLIYKPKDKSRRRLWELEAELQEHLVEARVHGEEEDSPAIQRLRDRIKQEKDHLNQPSFNKNEDSDLADADLVVIDECSMVGEEMANDLLSFDVPILVLGDPAQLPPVRSTGYFTEAEPDVMLTEIHRQALDNPILRLATMARNRQRIDVGQYGGGCEVLRIADFDYDSIDPVETQVLVGKNKTRRRANLRIRQNCFPASGRLIRRGEKVVALRNDKDTGVLNGSLWTVLRANGGDEDSITMILGDPDDATREVGVESWRHHFEGREEELRDMGWGRRDYLEFDYGYALTVHKAQGSEWDDVFLVNEAWGSPSDRARWLYTGITRAGQRIRIVQ